MSSAELDGRAFGRSGQSARESARIFIAGLFATLLAALLIVTVPAPLDGLRLKGFDLLQGVVFDAGEPSRVSVVAISEASLAELGPWPWPRRRVAQLIDRIDAAGAVSIAVNIIFDAEDRYSPKALARDAPELASDPSLRGALEGVESGDAALAASLGRSDAALATLLREATAAPESDAAPPFSLPVEGGALRGVSFDEVIAPLPELARGALAQGAANLLPDPDLVLRRAPSGFLVHGAFHPGLPLAALTAAGSDVRIRAKEGAPKAVLIDGRETPVDMDGAVWLDFLRVKRISEVEASALLRGDLEALGRIAGRHVVLGVTAPGVGNVAQAADGALLSGPFIVAATLDALLTGSTLVRWSGAVALEIGVFAAMALAVSTLWAFARSAWAMLAGLAMAFAWIAWAMLARAAFGAVLDPLLPGLGLGLVSLACAYAFGRSLERRRRELMLVLASRTRTAEQAVIAKSAFLTEIGHDFRTPVNAIEGAARMVSAHARANDLVGVLEHVHAIESLTGHLRILFRRSVAAAELGDGEVSMTLAVVDLREVLETCRNLAVLASNELHVDAAVVVSGVEVVARVDEPYVRAAVLCLISNAIDYGGVDGPVDCAAGLSEAGEPFIEIADLSGGIADELMAAVAEPAASRRILAAARGSYGLGLFVAKAVAERHDGRLEVTRRRPRGLCARLVFPKSCLAR